MFSFFDLGMCACFVQIVLILQDYESTGSISGICNVTKDRERQKIEKLSHADIGSSLCSSVF